MLARPKLLRYRELLRPVSAPEGRVFSADGGIEGQRVSPEDPEPQPQGYSPISKDTPIALDDIYQTACEDSFSMDC